jgi:GNAT superfamily N-acetyltransferase
MSTFWHRWRHLYQGGLARIARTVVARYVYGAYEGVVVRASLAGPPAADRVGDVIFRHATDADLNRLQEFDRFGRGSVQRAYVRERNDWLFVACQGERIVATRRYSHDVRDGRMSRVISLGRGQVWAADVFALPEYRSQGIGRRLAFFGDRFLAAQSYTELYASIDARNEPSLRLSLGKGTELVEYVIYRRLLFYERVRRSSESLRALKAQLDDKRRAGPEPRGTEE